MSEVHVDRFFSDIPSQGNQCQLPFVDGKRKNLLGNPLGCSLSDCCLPVVGWRLWNQLRRCILGWHHFVQTGCLLDTRSGT